MRSLLSAIALCLPLVTFAQTSGSITGEVKDQSGAVAPNAAVTATNSDTNVMRSTTTNAAGIYSFPDLTPGMYQVKVTAAGFTTVVKTNIELQVQQMARVDFSLSLGQAATGEPPVATTRPRPRHEPRRGCARGRSRLRCRR